MKKSILLFVTAISFFFSAISCVNSNQAIIQAQAKVANRSCPMEIGNGLTLEKVEFTGSYVVYYYKGEEMYFSQEDVTPEMKDQIVQTLQEQAKNDVNTKKFIEALKKEHVGIIYHYYNGSGMIMDVVIEARDLEENRLFDKKQSVVAVEVDLGLPSGCLWSEINLGALSSEESGYYFFWGDTSPCKKGSRYKYVNDCYYDGGCESQYLKYVTDPENGIVDGKTVLDSQDDAASVMLGDSWTVPTVADVEELLKYCSWKEANRNGVEGVEFVGLNGNSLFFPDLEHFIGLSGMLTTIGSWYWTQSLSSGWGDQLANAMAINHTSEGTNVEIEIEYRTHGGFIRPVKHK